MNVRVIGWTVSGAVLGVGLALAAAGRFADDETRRRLADSAGLVRGRASETAQDVREKWTETALEVRDRWTSTAEEVRARVEDTADQWRDRSSEGFERAILQAAEARDSALDPLDDEDEAADADVLDPGEPDAEAAR